MTQKRVAALLQDIQLVSERNYQIIQNIRNILLSEGRNITEEVKYGGILFSNNKPFCGAFAYKEHVSIEFSSGAELTDGFGFLEGNGKHRRHIKLNTVDDVETKKVRHYISAALKHSAVSKAKKP